MGLHEIEPPLIQLAGIRKSFGAVSALRGVDLCIQAGEVVGIVGDNAAGKSTLMKVLCGAYRPDAGVVRVGGQRMAFASPEDARNVGIEMIYQEFALAEDLNVAENIFLGKELLKPGVGRLVRILDRKRMTTLSQQALERLGMDLGSLKESVANLSGGQRQAIAIARAMTFAPRLIIMDEPTASLSLEKVWRLLELIKTLKADGVAVALVTHRLQDIFDVTDRVVVLRYGEKVSELATSQTNVTEVVAKIVGHTDRVEGVASEWRT